MPVLFDRIALKNAKAMVDARLDDAAAVNFAYYSGDAWQEAEGWIGPVPESTDSDYSITLVKIRRAFISRNVIAEVTNRHVGGVLGREPDWGFVPTRALGTVERIDPTTGETVTEDEQPTEGEQAQIEVAEAALVEWWDKREVQEILQQAAAALLLGKRAVLRLYVPPGLRDAQGNVPSGELGESLDRIWLQHLGTNEDTLDLQFPSATVYVDKNSRREVGVFTYMAIPADALPGDSEAEGTERAEVCYLDEAGNTIVRIIGAEGNITADDGQPEESLLPLGGRLLLFEMTRPPLVGEQIVSQQKLLNLSETMKGRNVVQGGFLERLILNGQTPDPFYVGAGTTNSIIGVKYLDAAGNEQITTPSVVYRDPVSTDTFDATSSAAYRAILGEANQLHYLTTGDSNDSGESRKQARESYQRDLQLTAGKVEAATRWLLETVLAMASAFSGQAGQFESLRSYVQTRIDSGPISADEKRVAAELLDKGLRSTLTALSESGIEDPDAELERIEAERGKSELPSVDDIEGLLNGRQPQPPEQEQEQQEEELEDGAIEVEAAQVAE